MTPKIEGPNGKQFAFTIFDDPDHETVDDVAAIYPFLGDLGCERRRLSGLPEGGGNADSRYKEIQIPVDPLPVRHGAKQVQCAPTMHGRINRSFVREPPRAVE